MITYSKIQESYMIKDPYEILGVPCGSSLDECTKAYKKLAKKYHPDLNPDDATAQQKMAEINAAYDQIKSGNTTSYSGSNASTDTASYYAAVVRFIDNNQFAQAVNLLDKIENKNDVWYYLASVAYYGLGRRNLARQYIDTACSMSPDNDTYRRTRQRIFQPAAQVFYDFSDFDDFDDFDRDSTEYQKPSKEHRRVGCLGRILIIILVILLLRSILSLIFTGYQYYRVPRYRTPAYSYSSDYNPDTHQEST